MTDAAFGYPEFTLPRRRRSRRGPFAALPLAMAVAAGTLTAAVILDIRPAIAPTSGNARRVVQAHNTATPPQQIAATIVIKLLDPAYSLGPSPVTLASSVPLEARFAAPPRLPVAPDNAVATIVPAVPTVSPLVAATEGPTPPIVSAQIDDVPLPTPRPPELAAAPRLDPVRTAERASPSRRRSVTMASTAAPAPADARSLFDRLFGIGTPSPGPVLAYAAPEDGLFNTRRSVAAVPMPGYDRFTAVYDIEAHTVFMPDGSRLEAHSGLGDRLDDPRRVHERMRGPTPPHLYDLTMREQLFHGVQALRLNPVGSGNLFGRNGLLAHTYMLGPNGDSNGCVSFRDYKSFLQAYQSGVVKRLAVVARRS